MRAHAEKQAEKATQSSNRKRIKEQKLDEELEEVALSLEPLGVDRFGKKYWWTRASPDRLYIEAPPEKQTTELLPIVRAWVTAAAAGVGADSKRAAAQAALKSQLQVSGRAADGHACDGCRRWPHRCDL